MMRDNVYLLILLLADVLLHCEGSCVNNEKQRTDHNYNYNYNYNYPRSNNYVYAVDSICTYRMIYNPHMYNLKPPYDKHYENSIALTVETTISSSLISKIQRDSFTGTSTITSLSIEDSQISEIVSGAFNEFDALKILKLHRNNLTTLKDNTFSSLAHLEELEIPNNELTTLETDAFAELINLQILNLSFNNISKINHSFKSLQSLKELDISHNSLNTLESQSFQKMDSLNKIKLSNNKIFMIEASAFVDLKKLSQIDFTNNLITQIDPQAFKNLDSIAIIYLNNNNITELSAFENLKSLTRLNFDNNSLPEIGKSDFQNHTKLIELNLRENRIRSVDVGSFGNLHILERLDLSKNLLTSINTGTFSGLHSLGHLNLSRNQLNVISGFPFHNTPVIQNLDLSGNKLDSFDPSDLPQGSILDFQGNPVSCSSLTDLLKKLKGANVTLARGNTYGEISIHGIPCKDDEPSSKHLAGENTLETYLERDFKNSNFVKYFAERFQTESENKHVTDELTQIFKNFTNVTLSGNNERKSALTSISSKLEELIKHKSTNQQILEQLKLNKNGPLIENQNTLLERLIDLYNGENKTRNEYFTELLMALKNVSVPEKGKMADSNDARLIQVINDSRYDLYILVVTNIAIIIMLGMFMMVFIYFKYTTYGRQNARMSYANELKPMTEC